MIASVMSFMLLIPISAGAAGTSHLHGVVLGITPKTGDLIVRHDAFGGMPSMTMPFRVVPREQAKQFPAGAVIDGIVDTSTEPWTLRHVTSKRTEQLTSDYALRRVTVLHPGDTVPDTPFVDQLGRPFSFAQLRGQDVILSFIYTRCQDARMCPLISAKFRQLQDTRAKRNVHLVEVTLDPAFDRPNILAAYGKTFGANPKTWTLAVGDAKTTLDFAAQFGVTAFPDPNIGIIHAEDTVIIGPDGRINEQITENAWAPDEIYAQIDSSRGIGGNVFKRFDLWLSREAVALCGNSVGAFSGLQDLIIVLLIFAVLGWCIWRLARKIFAANP
jgi:protein SCO1/2